MSQLSLLFKQQLAREWVLQLRGFKNNLSALVFFLMIVSFFPLTLPPNPTWLTTMAPSILWLAILLSLFLSTEQLFQQDYKDGVIEQWLASGYPITLWVMSKLIICWCINLAPILVLSPVFGIMFSLSVIQVYILVISLLLGTPAMLLLCGLAAAFSTSINQKGALMIIVLLPLTLPIIIFGCASLHVAQQTLAAAIGPIALLMALSLLCISLLPFAISSIIRTTLTH